VGEFSTQNHIKRSLMSRRIFLGHQIPHLKSFKRERFGRGEKRKEKCGHSCPGTGVLGGKIAEERLKTEIHQSVSEERSWKTTGTNGMSSGTTKIRRREGFREKTCPGRQERNSQHKGETTVMDEIGKRSGGGGF